MTKSCEQCGQAYVKPSYMTLAKWAERRFCGAKCFGLFQRGKPHPRKDDGCLPAGPLREYVQQVLPRFALVTADGKATSSQVREAKGVTSLAAHLGVGERWLQRLLSSKPSRVRIDAVDRACVALGVHIGELYPEWWGVDETA